MDPTTATPSNTNNNNGTTAREGSTGEHVNSEEFLQTGRTGRRNALPDILNEQHVHTATADLSAKMQGLSTSGGDGPGDRSGGDYNRGAGPSSS